MEKNIIKQKEFIHKVVYYVPAGKYYIGDPYHVINKDKWKDFLGDDYSIGFIESKINNLVAISFLTKHGYGIYYDQNDNVYYVDSDIIGIVPIDMIEEKELLEETIKNNFGKIYEFKKDIECLTYFDGKLIFGNIIIDTN